MSVCKCCLMFNTLISVKIYLHKFIPKCHQQKKGFVAAVTLCLQCKQAFQVLLIIIGTFCCVAPLAFSVDVV